MLSNIIKNYLIVLQLFLVHPNVPIENFLFFTYFKLPLAHHKTS